MLARNTRVKPQSRIQTQQTGFLWCTALLLQPACSEFDCNYVTFPQNIFAVFTPSTAPAPPDDASPLAYSSQILLSETMTIIHSISWQNRELLVTQQHRSLTLKQQLELQIVAKCPFISHDTTTKSCCFES